MPRSANALVVMAKAPVAGEVKTRLVPPLSLEEAAELYRCLLLDLLDHVAAFEGADRYVAFTPAEAASVFQALAPPPFRCFPQSEGDLGQRMRAVFEETFEKGYQRAVVIGSDLPVLPADYLNRAFAALAESVSVVLGPSRDGGYYLLGLNRFVPEIFSDIPWGSERVLEATRRKLSRMGIEPLLLPVWFDVDRVEDLRGLERTESGAPTRLSELLKKLTALRNLSHGF